MPATLDRTAALLHDAVDAGRVPGVVAAVDRPGRGTRIHVLGEDGAGHLLRRDTVVRIASITKPVVAVAALALVEDGLLDLDEPVAAWLPEFAAPRVLRHEAAELDDTVPALRPITLYDLLTYRCGAGMLPRFSFDLPVQHATAGLGSDGPPGSYPLPDPDTWTARLAAVPLVAQPGTRWLYQTSGDLLGVLLARRCGTDLQTVLAERVFGPLGMHDTGFSVPVADRDRFVPLLTAAPGGGFAVVDPVDGAWAAPPVFPSGAGGLVSTLDDLLAFGRALRDGGAPVLSPGAVAGLTTDRLDAAQRAGAAPLPRRRHRLGPGTGRRARGPLRLGRRPGHRMALRPVDRGDLPAAHAGEVGRARGAGARALLPRCGALLRVGGPSRAPATPTATPGRSEDRRRRPGTPRHTDCGTVPGGAYSP
ncbi:serine hydrolase [Pseudonocardia sp. ICBG1293]|uniref:serine hydrolase domain-containing protein n=1 Tax=Pseudonocardia sp. ICBG1293 TaxID=2844382 RepID=UPI001CCD576D|nr:serine hydrolase domain-containing protein [Pseudonocardia sp. ICBG1293]